MQRVVATTVERFGGLDVVMANAGIASRAATLRAMSGENFDRVLDVNVNGVVNTVEAALPEIVRRRGHVVVVASIYAFWNGVGAMPYAMSKAAVEQLGRALRVELVQHGASASVAYFGFIDTEMVHQGIDQDPLADEMFEALPKVLHKRLTPAQAGEAVVRGIEQRKPRIIVPRRWIALSVLRGITGPMFDRSMERNADVQSRAREDGPARGRRAADDALARRIGSRDHMAVDLVIDIDNTPGALARGRGRRSATPASTSRRPPASGPATAPSCTSSSSTPRPPGTRSRSRTLAVTREREVVVVEVEDRPGVLADLTHKIAAAGVDLDLVYIATRNRVVFGARTSKR